MQIIKYISELKISIDNMHPETIHFIIYSHKNINYEYPSDPSFAKVGNRVC